MAEKSKMMQDLALIGLCGEGLLTLSRVEVVDTKLPKDDDSIWTRASWRQIK